MTEEIQTEIEKRIEEAAWNFEGDVNVGRDCYNCNGYSNGLTEGFYEGAKFILMLPELREIREVLEWYATKGEGPYTDSGIWRRAVYALEKLKALGIVKEGE